MLQANELRIGNCIYMAGGKLYRIENAHALVYIEEHVWKDCEPVPLTPEILRATGMVDRGWHSEFRISAGEDTELTVTANSGYYSISDDGNYGVKGKLDIKYLHQLQNLYFALTGDELDVKFHNRFQLN